MIIKRVLALVMNLKLTVLSMKGIKEDSQKKAKEVILFI